MKRIETPLQASMFLDALTSPVTLTGNITLQVQSPQWLRVMYTCLTKPLIPFASFLSVFKSFPGYHHFIIDSSGVRTSALLKFID